MPCMKKWITLIVIVLSLGTLSLSAQNYTSTNNKAVKLFEKGQRTLYQGNAADAVALFEQAVAADPQFAEANLMLAEWWYDQGRHDLARQYYAAVVKHHPTFFTQAWLQLGNLALAEGDNDQAIEHYNQFLSLDKKNPDRHDAARQGIRTARFRQSALQHPVPFDPQNMGPAINSADDEYLPSLTVDGSTLVFTRRVPRRPTTANGLSEEEDFYISHYADGQWSVARRMEEPVNSNDNEGAQCLSQDGRLMFFTACGRPDGAGRCDLYMCSRKGDQWSKPRNMGTPVNTAAWESQPSFSIDGRTLFFVSNRKGGYGGMDLWKTVFVDGKGWSVPENLGPAINTEGDEMSPFIHFDGRTLYFSSNGHTGMGGMDLFRSTLNDDGSWSEPVNLGFPINTAGDESNLLVARDGRSALFSSDRSGGYGRQDLYTFQLPDAVQATSVDYVRGTVTDGQSHRPLRAGIQVIDLATGRQVASTNSDATDGSYLVSLPEGGTYAFHVSANDYLFFSDNYNLHDQTPTDGFFVNDIALSPIAVGQRVTLRNVFFATGQHTLLDESKAELDAVAVLLQQNPTLRVELGGHTDNVGKESDNQLLSEQRARAVRDYLVAQGIDAQRLTHKGYGESQPVADNDTAEGRSLNRRTEFKIISK